MASPLVSAVTIVRDGERFLAEAIDSVLRQTYPNLELVVVDDGSTDRSAEIADRVARARAGTHPARSARRRGKPRMSAARTLGVQTTRGGLIAFLDADDVWLPDKIAEQVAASPPIRPPGWSMAARRCGAAGRTRRAATPSTTSASRPIASTRRSSCCHSSSRTASSRRRRATHSCAARPTRRRAGPRRRSPAWIRTSLLRELYPRSATYVSSRSWARYRRHEGNEPRERFSYARYYRERRAFLEWLAEHLADGPVDEAVAAVLTSELRRRSTRIAPRSRHDCGLLAPQVRRSAHASTATVSVIVPFLDAGSHLEQTIASVEAQEHDRFELILVDDGRPTPAPASRGGRRA